MKGEREQEAEQGTEKERIKGSDLGKTILLGTSKTSMTFGA